VQIRDGQVTFAFFGDVRKFPVGTIGTVDDVPHRVVSAQRSDPAKGGVKGMVRLAVEKIEADTEG
jgi:translation elongation factor P/translation initiation factor 5A